MTAEFREAVQVWFESLRDQLVAAFEQLEVDCGVPPGPGGTADQTAAPGHFECRSWRRPGGGGGVTALLRGRLFEKAGINVSTVSGSFAPEFARQIPGAAEDGAFWASGISLVAHPLSPKVPTVHFNTRRIETTKGWFGGGADLTPIVADAADRDSFHAALQGACDRHDADYYVRFKKWCDEYFFLPHRNEPRGVGGVFFDYLETSDVAADFAFVRDVGETFLDIYPKLVRRHMREPWSGEERAFQLQRRGRYAEFNLLYDRGTQFGLKTGGDAEAILMSLPPEARWP